VALRSGRGRCVAIDYDRRQVRLVVFESVRKATSILALHAVPVPSEVDVADPSSLGGFLKTVVDKLHLRGARALLCVGRAQAVLKSLLLPPGTDAAELPSMVQFQVARELPFAADEAVVDFIRGAHWDTEPAGEADGGTTVLAAAVRLPVVDAAVQVCTDAGLKLHRLGLRPYANMRAVYRCVRVRAGERVLLVNVTSDEAEISVMRDESLEFSRVATVPSVVADAGEAPDEGLRAASVRRVIAEVTRSLQSFHAAEPGAEIHACLVAGATGLETELVAALSERLGVPCEVFDPSGGFSVRSGADVSAFGAALGLVASADQDVPFDFFNPKRPPKKRDVRKIKGMAIAAGVAALLLGTVVARSMFLSGRQEIVEKRSEQRKTLKAVNKQLKTAERRAEEIRRWQGAEIEWLDQLAHLANTLPGAKDLVLTGLQCRGTKVTLAGKVKEPALARFSEALMKIAGYDALQKTKRPARDRHYDKQFTMDVLISPGAKPIVTTTSPTGRPARPAMGPARTTRK